MEVGKRALKQSHILGRQVVVGGKNGRERTLAVKVHGNSERRNYELTLVIAISIFAEGVCCINELGNVAVIRLDE
jgi:hypothetical protein